MDWNQAFNEIEKTGFVIIPNILENPKAMAEIKENLDIALSSDIESYSSLPGKHDDIVLDLVTKGSVFLQLLENEKMHKVFSHFLSDTCILYSFTSTILRPNKQHYACEIHTDMPRLVPNYHLGIVMTLAIDDFTETNGATYYLPGSHRSIEKPSKEEFYKNAVRVTRKAGDAVFFHPRVWHAGGLNQTTSTRYGCTIYAVRSWMRQRFDFPRMISDEVLSHLGERGRSFLGFNVRVPTNLKEYYVPPEQRLYKASQG